MDVVALLSELVRRPSVNPMGRTNLPNELIHEHRVTDYLEAQFRGLGVTCRRTIIAPGRANLVAEFQNNSSVTLMWEAHQDTVPVDGMTIEPFSGEVRDGKLWGRGACDVKAGVATMFCAFAKLVREKPKGAANVVLAFTVDEEHTFLGAQELVNDLPPISLAVVAEPTGLNIVNAHKGVVRWALEVVGRACHSSRPQDGVSAIYRMATIVTAIEQYAHELQGRTPHAKLGPPSISVGMIHGGVSPNTVPDACRIELDRRLLPGETAATAHADLLRFVQPRVDCPFTIHQHLACPALEPIPENQAVLMRLRTTIDAVVGRHELHAVPYGTDASTIAGAGIPAIVFGPGDIAQAHTKDEYIALEQLAPAVEILFRFAAGPW